MVTVLLVGAGLLFLSGLLCWLNARHFERRPGRSVDAAVNFGGAIGISFAVGLYCVGFAIWFWSKYP